MTSIRDFVALEEVTQLLYQREMQSFRSLVAQEAELRIKLTKLDKQLRASQTGNDNCQSMRSIGADVIWQSWVGRQKADLNMQLARVLAIKEQRIAQVRLAFGKKTVAEQLKDEALTNARKAATKTELTEIIDGTLSIHS